MLVEVTFRVHESYGNERKAHIAGLLEMVSCKESEPAGIQGKGMVEPVLRGEVRNAHAMVMGMMFGEPVMIPLHFILEPGHDQIVIPEIQRIV
jgi:hypothetical protein